MMKPPSTKPNKYPAAWLYLIGGFLSAGILMWRMYTFEDFQSMILPRGSLSVGLFILAGTILLILLWQLQRVSERTMFFVFAGLVAVFPIMITLQQVSTHQRTTGQPYEVDSGVQTEVAAGMLLAGKNPYQEDFSQTAYGAYQGMYYSLQQKTGNIAWQHYAYPPLTFLVAAPIRAVFDWCGAVYDTRVAVLLFYLFGGLAVTWAMSTWSRRALAWILTIGNPLWVFFLAAGFNDAQFAAMLIVTAVALHKKKYVWSAVALALACGLKQLAWPMAGLWVVYVLMQAGAARWRAIWVFAGISLAIFGPFLIWNTGAMYDDIVRYVSGMEYGAYPISGLTVLQYLRVWHIISDPWMIVPAWILQAAVGLPVLAWGAWTMWRRASATAWLISGSLFILAIGIVARYQYENYIASIMIMLLSAACLYHQEQQPA